MRVRRAVVISVVCLMGCAALAAADDGRIEIGPAASFPIVIDAPGSYVLTTDLTVSTNVSAISITSSDVTLDLAGHVIQGPGSGTTGSGVFFGAALVTNTIIRNGVVRGFYMGVAGGDGTMAVDNLTASNNLEWGIWVAGPGEITDCRVTDSGQGIYCSGCIIRNCTAMRNLGIGLQVYGGSILGSVAADNLSNGIGIGGGSLVEGCVSRGNTLWGVGMDPDGGNNVVNSTAVDNDAGDFQNCGNGNSCYQNNVP